MLGVVFSVGRTTLARLVQDIENRVSTTKDYFHNIPSTICNDVAAKIYDEDNCWNGNAVGRCVKQVSDFFFVCKLRRSLVVRMVLRWLRYCTC